MYFDGCNSLDDLKKAYKALVVKNHPDMGGDTRTMQDINAEHDRVFNVLKSKRNAEAKADANVRATTEMPEEFREIMAKLIAIPGIDIELCGSWLWIGGDTKPVKDQLKAAGCRWAKNKGLWYWRHEEDGAWFSRGGSTMAEIRQKYGSERIEATERKRITA